MPDAQKWITDALVSVGGYNTLRPDRAPWHELVGYDHSDLEAVFEQIRCVDMLPKAFAEIARQVEEEAHRAAAEGHVHSARRFYLRAALLYGRGQYHIYHDSPLKHALHQKMRECYERVIQYNTAPVERVEIPFESSALVGILHRPLTPEPPPIVLMIPGMDALKEERHVPAQWFVERGIAVLVLDGPGQGESLLRGIKVTIDNYERAGSAAIDMLENQGQFRTDRVAVFGTSMGSYWATRIAAHDGRVVACATAMGCYGPMDLIFKAARPSFRQNYKYMSGVMDDEAFDAMIADMDLTSLAPRLTCPSLVVHGEYDELHPLDHALVHYERLPRPKALWVFEDEFHPMGRRAADFLPLMMDWVEDRLLGKPVTDEDERVWFRSRRRGGGRRPFAGTALDWPFPQ